MSAFTLVSLVVLLALTATGVKGDHPGFKARVTQSALNYASQRAMDALAVQIPTLNIGNRYGTANGGDLRYWLSNMRITRFNRPSSSISIAPGTGLSWTANNADISVYGNWRIKYKLFWIFTVPASGTLTGSANGISFSTTIGLGKDNEGRPSIRVARCSCNVNSVNVRFSNSLLAWVLNLFSGRVESAIRQNAPGWLCGAIREQVNTNAQNRLQELQVVVPMAEEFLLDYRLLSAPVFQRTYMETLHKGEVTWAADPQSPPFSPQPLPIHPSSNRMLYLWINEYLPQSFFHAAQEHGFLKYNITADSLAPDHRGLLNTTCTGFACLGHLIPAVSEQYPDSTVELRIDSTSMPQVKMEPGQLTANMTGDIAFYANTSDGQTPYLFTLAVTATFSMTGRVVDQVVVGSITDSSFSSEIRDSAVGQMDSQAIDGVLNYAMQNLIIPKMNEQGNRGFPLLITDKFRLVNTQLQIQQNAMMIATDMRYQLH